MYVCMHAYAVLRCVCVCVRSAVYVFSTEMEYVYVMVGAHPQIATDGGKNPDRSSTWPPLVTVASQTEHI